MSESNMKLFAVYLGGRITGCNIELHDVVFVVGENIEDTYPQLMKKWFGSKNRLHIDSYVVLQHIDGYRVNLQKHQPALPQPKIYFVNYGGYHDNFFGEIHEMAFFIDENKTNVRKRANEKLGLTFHQKHLDDQLKITDHVERREERIVDDIIELSEIDGYYLSIEPSTSTSSLEICSGYHKVVVTEKSEESV